MTVREDFQAVFLDQLREYEDRTGFEIDEWFNSGPMTPKTSVAWWMENGPTICRNFMLWYERSGARVWTTPDGKPAVELRFDVNFGEVPVRGAVDMVLDFNLKGNTSPDALCVVDLKSGTTKETSPRQLAVYAGALELEYGVRPKYGAYFMARGLPARLPPEQRTYFQTPYDLSGYQHSVKHLSGELAKFDHAVELGVFPANPGPQCDRCGVAHACLAVGGMNASVYDPSHPDYERNKDGR